jgi:hypothetical protein
MNAPADHAPVSLAEQARRLGVADRYHGFWGKEEIVPESVLQRAVDAMRGNGGDAAPQHDGLPRVQVVHPGEESVVRWTSHEGASAHWVLVAEDTGLEVAAGELQRSYQQAAVALPADIGAGYYRLHLRQAPAQEHCRVIVAPRQALRGSSAAAGRALVGLHHPAVCAALGAQLGHRRLRRPAPAVRRRRAPGRVLHRPEPAARAVSAPAPNWRVPTARPAGRR